MTLDTVLMIIRKKTNHAATADTPIDDLGMDSLDFIELVHTLECAANKEIDFKRFTEIKRLTVGHLAKELV